VKGKIVVCEGVFATNGTCSKSQRVEQWFRFKPMCAKGACKRVKVTIKGRNGTLQGTAVLHRHNATTPQGVDGIPDWELPIKGKLRDVKCGDGSEAAALSDYTFFAREARNGRATKISATLFERPSGRSVGPYFFPDNTTCPSFKEFIEFGPQPGGSSNGGGA
jgi:hypothetical protein